MSARRGRAPCARTRAPTACSSAGMASTPGAATWPRRGGTWRSSSSSSRWWAGCTRRRTAQGAPAAVRREVRCRVGSRRRQDARRRGGGHGVPGHRGYRVGALEPAHPVAARRPRRGGSPGLQPEIDRLKALGGYVTADVIDVKPETPNLDAMLAKFRREHWHDEDEVRFILEGSGIFFIHPRTRPVFAIEVAAGRPHPRAPGHLALVRPVRRAPHPRHPPLPGSRRLDPPLHRERRGRGLRARVPGVRAI